MKKKIFILIVDDETGQIWIMGDILKDRLKTLSFFEAEDGQQALEIIENEKNLDMVISDIQMPNLSGVELLKKVKKLRPELPVLLITGNSTFDRKKIMEMGAIDLLYKPYDSEELIRIVQKTVVLNN